MPHLNQTLLKALEKIQEKKLADSQAQPVFIKDLILLEAKNPNVKGYYHHGEYEGVDNSELLNESNAALTQRLLKYMEALGNQVQEIHNQNHQQNPNYITRLLMPEAFLFPAFTRRHEIATTVEKGGITFENLTTLVAQLQVITSHYSTNVHLLFSSIPVSLPDKTIHNIAIYIQCGESPIIHVFAKAYGNVSDSRYISTKLFSVSDDLELVLPSLRSSEQVQQNVGVDLEYSSIIPCHTSAGVCFYTGIDICADHIAEVGKNRMQANVHSSRRKGASNFIAGKGSYVVTSNTVDLQPQSELTSMITHADPSKRGSSAVLNAGAEVYRDEDIKITAVTSTIFGPKRVLYEYPARELASFEQSLGTEILQHNRLMVTLNALRQYRAQRLTETDLVHEQCVKTVIEFLQDEIKTLLDGTHLKQSEKNVLMVFDFTLKKMMQEYPENSEAVLPILEAMQENIIKKYPVKDRVKTLVLVDICVGLINQDRLDNEAVKDEFPRLNFK